MSNFATLSDVNFLAFNNNHRAQDVVAKKQEILDTLSLYYNLSPTKILFVGFSSFVMAPQSHTVYITSINNAVQDYLTQQKIKYQYVPEVELVNYRKQFDVVVAVDEYFTYSNTDQNQKDLVAQISSLATDYVITTLRDYKNQDYKDRELSQPSVVRNAKDATIFLESHNWDIKDRANWQSTIYAINQTQRTMSAFGEFNRRTMYFKQLANFSAAAGASDFVVHKNLMYKGLFKKNYEHVITVKFE